MNNEKMEWLEPVVGGVFGVIAIIAAIVEYNMGDGGALAGCVKDIAGTLIVVVLFIAFLRNLPRKAKNIEVLLENAVETWGDGNAPLIFKAEGYKTAQGTNYEQGYVLLVNPRSYVSLSNKKMTKGDEEWNKYANYNSPKLTGKFINMPSYKDMTESNYDVLFVMGQTHFKEMEQIGQIINDIVSAINMNCKGVIKATRVGSSYEFTVSCPRIQTKEDIQRFVCMLDYVISLVKVVA